MVSLVAMDAVVDEYIQQRLEQYRSWYDRRAVSCKRRYLGMRSAILVLTVSVPVLTNLVEYSSLRPVITIASLLVVLLLSLEHLFRYQEQWKNYRSTEQFLGRERYQFQAGAGVYRGMSGHDAFQLLTTRVEEAVSAENAATLHILPDGRKFKTE